MLERKVRVMFCPKCGKQLPDSAAFCPACGTSISSEGRETTGDNAAAQQQSQPVASTVQGETSQGMSNAKPQINPVAASPRKKRPIIPIAIAAVVVLVVVGFFASGAFGSSGKTTAKNPTAASAPANSSASSSSAKSSSKALTENSANTMTPKQHIEVSDLKLDTDSLNRYVVTGKVTNKSNQSYDAEVSFTCDKHSSDKYQEEKVDSISFPSFTVITPFCSSSGSDLILSDLMGGETRAFTLYPDWQSIEETMDHVQAEVRKVSLPDAQSNTRYDHDGGIKITNMEYTADGKVRGNYKNDSGMYLNEFELTVLGYGKDGLPVVRNSSGARPSGTELYSTSVNTLKPGDEGTFEMKVGEGFSKVEPVHVTLTPDKDKNSWS